MSSNPEKYGVIDNGHYNVNRVEQHGTYEKEWAINNGGKVDALGGYNPSYPERVPGWLNGTYIHRSNWSGFTGYNNESGQAVSKGCLIILGKQWISFNKQLENVNSLYLILNRE